MHLVAVRDGPVGRDQGVGGDLPTEHALQLGGGLASAEQVVLDDSRSSSAISSSAEAGMADYSSGSSRRARNCSNWAPISSPLGRGSSSASRLAALEW